MKPHNRETSDMDMGAAAVRFDDNSMWVELSDGRTLGIPYAWFPRLFNATPAQREAVESAASVCIGRVSTRTFRLPDCWPGDATRR